MFGKFCCVFTIILKNLVIFYKKYIINIAKTVKNLYNIVKVINQLQLTGEGEKYVSKHC